VYRNLNRHNNYLNNRIQYTWSWSFVFNPTVIIFSDIFYLNIEAASAASFRKHRFAYHIIHAEPWHIMETEREASGEKKSSARFNQVRKAVGEERTPRPVRTMQNNTDDEAKSAVDGMKYAISPLSGSPVERSRESKTIREPRMDKKRGRVSFNRKRVIGVTGSGADISRPFKKKRIGVPKTSSVEDSPKTMNRGPKSESAAAKMGILSANRKLDSHNAIIASINPDAQCRKININEERTRNDKKLPSLYDRIVNRASWLGNSSSLHVESNSSEEEEAEESERDMKLKNENASVYSDEELHSPLKPDKNIWNSDEKDEKHDFEIVADVLPDHTEAEDPSSFGSESDRGKCSVKGRDDTFELEIKEVNETEEGQNNWETSSDFDGEDDPLLLAMKSQERRYSKNTPIARSAAAVSRLFGGNSSALKSERGRIGNMKDEWAMEYQRKPPSFFSSSTAKMEVDQTVLRTISGQHRASSYNGVHLNVENNSDIAFVHQEQFQTETQGDRSKMNTYYNFTVCMGQLVRVGIALNKLPLEDLWKPGQLFKISSNINLFRYFMKYFGNSSTPATLMNKAAQLIKFVDTAIIWYEMNPLYGNRQDKNMAHRAKILSVARLLRRDRSGNKSRTRKIRQKTKEDWHRCAVGKFINEEMFDLMRSVATDALHGILHTVYEAFETKGAADVTSQRRIFADAVLKNWALLRKWSVNFLAMLLLYGNGQRNQVYTFLKCPSTVEMHAFEEACRGGDQNEPILIQIHEDEKLSSC